MTTSAEDTDMPKTKNVLYAKFRDRKDTTFAFFHKDEPDYKELRKYFRAQLKAFFNITWYRFQMGQEHVE